VNCVASVTVDVLDRIIIQALYIDPRASFSRLAEVLGSSGPRSRPSPDATGGCSMVMSCGLLANSIRNGSACPTGQSASAVLRAPLLSPPPNWRSSLTPPG